MTTEELHNIVVRLAKALGVWPSWADSYRSMDGEELSRLGLAINRLGGSPNFRVWISLGRHRHVFRDVDARTALLLLLGHARGVVLNVGPCSECNGERLQHLAGFDTWKPGYSSMAGHRNCPACAVDDEPTGRDHRPWARALLDAMPRPGDHWVNIVPELAEWMPQTPIRTALTAWSGAADFARYERLGRADTVDDTLAVWHDDHLARGGECWQKRDGDDLRWTSAAPVGLAEHPTLARLTAAWLAGECQQPVWVGDQDRKHSARCECGGTGTTLGSKTAELAAEAKRVIAAKERAA